MIALGGAIGTGLFLGSTLSIRIAGPAVIASYLLGAIVALLMTLAVGQLTVRHPTAGSFGVHAELYLGSLAGFTVKWSYWFAITISIGGEAIATGIYTQFWFPNLPIWVPATLFSLGLVAVNAMHVGAFGTFEYWFAMIKVVAIVLFILFGISILAGLREADVPGLAGYQPPAPNGWVALLLAMPVVMFSYLGTEIIAVASGEAKDPETSIPRALRTTVVRLILFYVLSMGLLLALMPWRDITPEHSPFVRVFDAIGIPGAASVMSVVVLTAALSSMNTNLYITSRMLFSLARAGDAPAVFGRLGPSGTPRTALFASAIGMAIAAVIAKAIPEDAFVFFFGVSIFGGLYCWAMIFLTHVRYQGVLDGRWQMADGSKPPPSAIRDHALWRMAASMAGFAAMLGIIFITWFVPGLQVTLLSGIPWLVLLSIVWVVLRKLKSSRA